LPLASRCLSVVHHALFLAACLSLTAPCSLSLALCSLLLASRSPALSRLPILPPPQALLTLGTLSSFTHADGSSGAETEGFVKAGVGAVDVVVSGRKASVEGSQVPL
jgi:hypothetical protein